MAFWGPGWIWDILEVQIQLDVRDEIIWHSILNDQYIKVWLSTLLFTF